jgi:hypothetical protein
MMVIPTSEAKSEPSEVMIGVHLGSHQGNCSLVSDAMESNLPDVSGNILEMIHQQVASGVHSPSGIIRSQLESLQLLRQGCDNKRKGYQEKHDRAR